MLETTMHGTAIAATNTGLCNNLQSDFSLLHFICHGASDGETPGQQAIFVAEETAASDPTVENPDEEGESVPPLALLESYPQWVILPNASPEKISAPIDRSYS